MDRGRREVADAAVVVLSVVPGKEVTRPGPGFELAPEVFWGVVESHRMR